MLYSDSMLSRNFSSTFAEFTLAEFLSNFSLPVSLGDLKELFENEVNSEILLISFTINYEYYLSGGD